MTTADAPAIPSHARGVLAQTGDDRIILAVPGTDYQLHLNVLRAPSTPVGKRIVGTIRATARRVDVVNTGGRYIEPVYGRPRRVQGQVTAIDAGAQTITVHAGVPVVCTLSTGQRADAFKVGDFVSFDVMAGSTFTPTV